MKRFAFVLLASFFVFAGVAYAGNKAATKIMALPAGETVIHDYFAWGDVVEISGTVNGDVYAAGGTVLIDGVVNGDLLVAGGQVTISGEVTQDVRVAGGQVSVAGVVGQNVTAVGGNVDISSAATLGGSLVAAGGNIIIATPVNGNLKVGAGNLTLASSVDGDVEAGVGVLRLSSNADVSGDLTYYSEEDASIAEGATVSGEVVRKQRVAADFQPPKGEDVGKVLAGLSLFGKLVSFASTFVLGFLAVKYYPNFVKRNVKTINSRPGRALLVGFIGMIVTPIVGIILAVTIIGLPLAFVLFPLFFIILYLSRVFVMVWIGRRAFSYLNRRARFGWYLFFGILVYYLLTLIPVIGALVKLFTVLGGFGAFILSYRDTYTSARSKDIV